MKVELLKSDFYYDLPEELIAQHPAEPRNSSRMMCVDRRTGELTHEHFYDLSSHLREGDLLVMNDSRVIPARLYGEKIENGTFIEFLLLEQKGDKLWELICRPGKKAKVGTRFSFGGGRLIAEVKEVRTTATVSCSSSVRATSSPLWRDVGQMPCRHISPKSWRIGALPDCVFQGAGLCGGSYSRPPLHSGDA